MVVIPQDGDAPLIRTDFSNDAAWEGLLIATRRPSSEGFLANVQVINDARLDGVSAEQLGSAARGTKHAIIFLADEVTMRHADLAVLCIDASAPEHRFRVIPGELWSVENNLSLANMDFEEFRSAAGADDVFRGF